MSSEVRLERVVRPSPGARAARELARSVLRGEWEHGARLPANRPLADRLGVSISAVREAVVVLEVLGLVEVRGGSGVYVRTEIPSEVQSVVEAFLDSAGATPL